MSCEGGDEEKAKVFEHGKLSKMPWLAILTVVPVKVTVAPSFNLDKSRYSPAGTVIPESVSAVHALTAAATLS